jgi:hypothetical protein
MTIVQVPESYYYDDRYDDEDPQYDEDTSADWAQYFDLMFCEWGDTQPEFSDEQYEDGFPDDVHQALIERFKEAKGDEIQEEYLEWLKRKSWRCR